MDARRAAVNTIVKNIFDGNRGGDTMHEARATVANYVSEWSNSEDATVDEDGDIWIGSEQRGHWLDPEEMDNFLEWFEVAGK